MERICLFGVIIILLAGYGESMELGFEPSFELRKKADVLVVPCFKKEGSVELAAGYGDYRELVYSLVDLGDFSAKEHEIVILYDEKPQEKRLMLLGLGQEDKSTLELVRRSYAEAAKFAMGKKWKSLNVLLPLHSEYSPDELAYVVAESVLLTNYHFSFSAKTEKQGSLLEKITLIGDVKFQDKLLQEVSAMVKGVNFARDLVNGNADTVTPKFLADRALDLGKMDSHLKVKILDKEEIQKQGMGLFYAVSRGSSEDPYFIVVSYQGAPSSQDHTVLIGKGVTYDTGGLSLKPTSSMETMKCDMAGAAAVLGTMQVIAELKMQVNVSCVIAATENSIGSKSYKIGDVYQGYNKTTVEIKNTDAEGRLALADSLAYAVDQLKPTQMIDLATLTGAAEVALGNHRSPLFSNNHTLAAELFQAGEELGEKMWLMPLDQDYRELITAKIADLKNSGSREGSLIFSAMFLKEFVGDVPWAHIDIAGVAFLNKPRYYHMTSATGYGVRLLIQFLKKSYEKSKS